MQPTFSYVHEAYIDYEILNNFWNATLKTKELEMSQNYNRSPNEQTVPS